MSTIAVAPGFGTPRTSRTSGRIAAPAQSPAQSPVRPAAQQPARLTRRGRLVLLAVFVMMVFAVLTAFGNQSAATSEPGVPVPTRTVEVAQGQTLWGIASEVAEPGDVREMVHQIEELNALSGAGVAVGQEIAVPLG